jgi:hypothetical protein
MKVTETRKTPYGIKRRRYKGPGGQSLTTYEIPEAVARRIGLKTVNKFMGQWTRGEMIRETVAYRREFIRQRLDWKPDALSHELGIALSRVHAIRNKIIKEINEEATEQGNARRDAVVAEHREVRRDPDDRGRHD